MVFRGQKIWTNNKGEVKVCIYIQAREGRLH